MAKNQVYHARTKYIDVRYHKIREWLSLGDVCLLKVHIDENSSDMLKKSVLMDKFEHCLDLIHVISC